MPHIFSKFLIKGFLFCNITYAGEISKLLRKMLQAIDEVMELKVQNI